MMLVKSFSMLILCMCLGCPGSDDLHGQWHWTEGAGDESMMMSFSGTDTVVFRDSKRSLHGIYQVTSPDVLTITWEDGSVEVLEKDGDSIFSGGSYPAMFTKN